MAQYLHENETCCTATKEDTPRVSSCCKPDRHETLPEDAASVREVVREKYSQIAAGDISCGCSMIGDASDEVDGYVPEADLSLGCGLPVEHAGLLPGQRVLDLGSGAGLDAFVARRIVGDTGEVIGLDFSGPMVEKARRNARQLGYKNVRFVLGDIEQIPLSNASVDVIVSNCVLNLVPAKHAAFAEAYRVLRHGGRFAVSDVVLSGPLPDEERQCAESYVGCIAGAMEREAYLRLIRGAGFEAVQVVKEWRIPDAPGALSITVCGTKP